MKRIEISLLGTPELFDCEPIFLEVCDDAGIEIFRHMGLAIENPQILVTWVRNDTVGVVTCQSDDPVLSTNIESCNKLHFEFGVGCILRYCVPD